MLRHWSKFNGAPMAQRFFAPLSIGPREKPNGASTLHWVFFNGAPMAQPRQRGAALSLRLLAALAEKESVA
jgi:hypothetical protein